jgi:exo-1,4-beta-D-glucosaminidase
VTLDIPADGSVRALQPRAVEGISPTYFLKLELHDSAGKLVSDNFYWLSTKPDVLDWGKKFEEVYTPESAYADLTGLNSLPQVKLVVRGSIGGSTPGSGGGSTTGSMTNSLNNDGKEKVVHAFVENPSSNVAFMVHVRVAGAKDDRDVVPSFWDDNYVSLLPGEKRELSARFEAANAGADDLVLTVDGWNVTAERVALDMHVRANSASH